MKIDLPAVFCALRDYGTCFEVHEGRRDTKRGHVFQRIKRHGFEAVRFVSVKELGFFDRIKLWFGHSDFRLATISRVARRALSIKDTDVSLFADIVSPIGRHLSVALMRLNAKISSQRPISMVGRFLGRVQAVPIDGDVISNIEKIAKKCIPQQTRRDPISSRRRGRRRTRPSITPCIDGAGLRGISGGINLCYYNAFIKAFASSLPFREVLGAANTEIGRAFLSLCNDLECPETTPIEHSKGSLHRLTSLLKESFLRLGKEGSRFDNGRQQDVLELAQFFLESTLTPFMRKIKTERAPETDHYATYRKAHKGLLPSIHDLYIPTIDKEDRSEEDYAIGVDIREEGRGIDLQKYVDGAIIEETMTLDDIKNSAAMEESSDKRRQEINSTFLAKREELRRKNIVDSRWCLPSIEKVESYQLMGMPPRCLPIFVKRCMWPLKQSSTPVDAPFSLHISVGDDKEAMYVLRSIVVHYGSPRSGHYATYIAGQSTSCENGNMPTRWTYHSGVYTRPGTWEEIKGDVETKGCLYVYDLVMTRACCSA